MDHDPFQAEHSWRDYWLIAVICALCLGAILLFDTSRRQVGIDFYQFWAVSQIAGDRQLEVYVEANRPTMTRDYQARAASKPPREQAAAHFRELFEPGSSPLLYTSFAPFAYLEYEDAHYWYCALIIVCALASILTLCRYFGYSWPASLLIITCVVWLYQPLLSEIAVGGVNCLQLMVLALIVLLESQERSTASQVASGMVLVLLVLFKPNLSALPVLLWSSYLFRKDWSGLLSHAGGAMIGAVLGLGLSSAYFGAADTWPQWLEATKRFGQYDLSVSFGNYSLARILLEWTGAGVAFGTAMVITGILVAASAIWIAAGNTSPEAVIRTRLLAISAGCLLTMVVAPLAWLHYYLLLLPALLYAARPFALRNLLPPLIAIVLLFPGLLSYGGVELPPYAAGCLFAGSATALLVLVLARLYTLSRTKKPVRA